MDFPKSVPGVGLVGGQFADENPAIGQQGSLIPAAWGNAVTREILNVIESSGLVPSEEQSDQLLAAIELLVERYAPSSVLPLFMTGIHRGNRASLVRVFSGMATPNDGDEISALTHPELVKGILRGDQATCSDTEWLNDPYKRGMWSRGTAYLDDQGKPQGWVRMPDLNQAKEGSLPPPFARGGADAKAGRIGKDTMRELTGNITRVFNANNAANADGVFEKSAGSVVNVGGTNSSNASNFNFAASRGLPEGHTGDEFAPWHIYGVSYSITSNGVMNEGAIDAEQVMGEVLLNRGRIAALEGKDFGVTTQSWVNTTATRLRGVPYVADQTFLLRVEVSVDSTSGGGAYVDYTINGEQFRGATVPYGASALFVSEMLIQKGATFSFQLGGTFNVSTLKVREFRRA